MTIKVKIEHTQPGYDKCITVEEQGVDINGQPYTRNMSGYRYVVKPGESIERYVYAGNVLVVTEGPALADVPAPDQG